MANLLKFIKQGLYYPGRFIKGRKKSNVTVDSIKPGTGAVVDYQGKKVAVFKDSEEKISAYSAVCTHLGCIIGWDDAKKRWECPCHGSQYDKQGKVLRGPTKRDLPPVKIISK